MELNFHLKYLLIMFPIKNLDNTNVFIENK